MYFQQAHWLNHRNRVVPISRGWSQLSKGAGEPCKELNCKICLTYMAFQVLLVWEKLGQKQCHCLQLNSLEIKVFLWKGDVATKRHCFPSGLCLAHTIMQLVLNVPFKYRLPSFCFVFIYFKVVVVLSAAFLGR